MSDALLLLVLGIDSKRVGFATKVMLEMIVGIVSHLRVVSMPDVLSGVDDVNSSAYIIRERNHRISSWSTI